MPYEQYSQLLVEVQVGFTLINAILLVIGLWKLFAKCGQKRGWAFVPYLRFYQLAVCADAEDTGVVWLMAAGLGLFAEICYNAFPSLLEAEWYMAIIAAMNIFRFIYKIRIYFALCGLFGKKKRWVWLWMFVPFLPAMIWGISSSVKPDHLINPLPPQAAGVSGYTAQTLDSGLTVNLKARTAAGFPKRKTLLRDIHLNVKPGTMTLILGGSGAGKTTLINAIIGYEKANAKIFLDGEDVYREYDRMQYQIGVVPQQDLMRYEDTVTRTLTDAAVLRLPVTVTLKERRQRVKEVLEIFGLFPVRNNEVKKLSGGQKKRLSIAMEYICDPSLFVLDEPDSGLDGVLAKDLMRRLHEIARSGKTVMVITHSPDRVIEFFDEAIILAKDADGTGRLVFQGTVEETRKFFGTDLMEDIVKIINRKNEGGEGRADELIEKFAEVRNAGNENSPEADPE